MIIDSHAHLTSDELYPKIESILERAKEACISHIINICTDEITLERGLKLKKQAPWIFNTAAITPHDVDALGDAQFEVIAKAAREGHLVAIGETGLDYHYAHSTKEGQKLHLKRYIHLAQECKLPLVIHCRDAFADFFEILDQEAKVELVLHCFTGTLEEARGVIERGWHLSLSGIVTFKKAEELKEVAKWVPIEKLLIETDAPYLAPQSHRGKENEPAYIVETANFLAQIRGIQEESLKEITSNNAKRLFKL